MNKLPDWELEKIIGAAAELFLKNSIQATSVKDIAAKAECGEASIYRHFKTKDHLAIKAATRLANYVVDTGFQPRPDLKGAELMELFYRTYESVYTENSGFYRFLFELDALYLKDSQENLSDYENAVERYHKAFNIAYERGLKDGTLQAIPNVDLFYYSSTHALLNLCKFLAVSTSPFAQDKARTPEAEIRALTDIILSTVKKA